METIKKTERFNLRMTPEQQSQLNALAKSENKALGPFLIDKALTAQLSNPLYKNAVQTFLLHLEQLQTILTNDITSIHEANSLRHDLNQEAKKLWQSLNVSINNI